MAKPQLLEEKPLMLAELKEKLAQIKEKDKELNFRANKTEEYLSSIDVLNMRDAMELSKKLKELDISRMKDEHIAKIVDVLPKNANEARLLFQGTITLSADNIKKIVDLVNEYPKQQ